MYIEGKHEKGHFKSSIEKSVEFIATREPRQHHITKKQQEVQQQVNDGYLKFKPHNSDIDDGYIDLTVNIDNNDLYAQKDDTYPDIDVSKKDDGYTHSNDIKKDDGYTSLKGIKKDDGYTNLKGIKSNAKGMVEDNKVNAIKDSRVPRSRACIVVVVLVLIVLLTSGILLYLWRTCQLGGSSCEEINDNIDSFNATSGMCTVGNKVDLISNVSNFTCVLVLETPDTIYLSQSNGTKHLFQSVSGRLNLWTIKVSKNIEVTLEEDDKGLSVNFIREIQASCSYNETYTITVINNNTTMAYQFAVSLTPNLNISYCPCELSRPVGLDDEIVCYAIEDRNDSIQVRTPSRTLFAGATMSSILLLGQMKNEDISLTITESQIGNRARVIIYFNNITCDDAAAYTFQIGNNTYETVVSVTTYCTNDTGLTNVPDLCSAKNTIEWRYDVYNFTCVLDLETSEAIYLTQPNEMGHLIQFDTSNNVTFQIGQKFNIILEQDNGTMQVNFIPGQQDCSYTDKYSITIININSSKTFDFTVDVIPSLDTSFCNCNITRQVGSDVEIFCNLVESRTSVLQMLTPGQHSIIVNIESLMLLNDPTSQAAGYNITITEVPGKPSVNLQFHIPNVTCRDEGVYTFQVNSFNYTTGVVVTKVNVNTCDMYYYCSETGIERGQTCQYPGLYDTTTNKCNSATWDVQCGDRREYIHPCISCRYSCGSCYLDYASCEGLADGLNFSERMYPFMFAICLDERVMGPIQECGYDDNGNRMWFNYTTKTCMLIT